MRIACCAAPCLLPRVLFCCPQLQGMLSPFGELKDCVVIVEKMSQKSKVRRGALSVRLAVSCKGCHQFVANKLFGQLCSNPAVPCHHVPAVF
jgi:hypothetical protein